MWKSLFSLKEDGNSWTSSDLPDTYPSSGSVKFDLSQGGNQNDILKIHSASSSACDFKLNWHENGDDVDKVDFIHPNGKPSGTTGLCDLDL